MEITFSILFILFFVAILAGMVDSISGGGGLIAVPAMLLAGISPTSTLATNKLQGTGATFVASVYFLSKKVIKLNDIKLLLFMVFVGSGCGVYLLLKIDGSLLSTFIPILLILASIYFIFMPNRNELDKKQLLTYTIFSLFLASFLGFYDGFFGPGTGILMLLAVVSLLGYGLSKATALTKVMNFASNFAALIYFALFGQIIWKVGLVMMGGQMIGAYFGSRLVSEKGAKVIKPMVISTCILLSLTLILKRLF